MRAANTADLRAAMAHRLTPRDRWLLAMLHEHRVLTTHQVQAVAFPSGRSARRRLLELWEWSMIDRFRPQRPAGEGAAPWHWTLALGGAQVLAAEHDLTPDQIGYRRERARSIAHHQALAHTVEVADVFLGLVEHTQHVPGTALTRWWGQARCTRLFGDLARPDAYGRWRVESRPAPTEIEFFLELDRGTERPARRLGERLHDYARLAEATAIATPVLVWTHTRAREADVRRALFQTWAELDERTTVPVATACTAAADAAAEPPVPAHTGAGLPAAAAPVWAPLGAFGLPPRRHRLHELAALWRLPPITDTDPEANTETDTDPHESGSRPEAEDGPDLPAPHPMPPLPRRPPRSRPASMQWPR